MDLTEKQFHHLPISTNSLQVISALIFVIKTSQLCRWFAKLKHTTISYQRCLKEQITSKTFLGHAKSITNRQKHFRLEVYALHSPNEAHACITVITMHAQAVFNPNGVAQNCTLSHSCNYLSFSLFNSHSLSLESALRDISQYWNVVIGFCKMCWKAS